MVGRELCNWRGGEECKERCCEASPAWSRDERQEESDESVGERAGGAVGVFGLGFVMSETLHCFVSCFSIIINCVCQCVCGV